MKGKIGLVVGGAVGYLLGARAGRERYEQIMTQARSLWQNSPVQQAGSHAQGGTPPQTYPNADAPLGDQNR